MTSLRAARIVMRRVADGAVGPLSLCALTLCLALAAPSRVDAQRASARGGAHDAHVTSVAADSAIRAFVAAARAGSARYVEPAAALRDGFQPIGVETPGMGQHWVSATRVFRATFDVAQPAGLQYATIRGRLTLVGVAYLVPLLAGEDPPPFPGTHRWHMHAGTVDEETLIADHDAAVPAQGPRVAILHAWVWTDNPAGVFAPDNWSLPFVRAGLVARSTESPAVARVLALASGGAAHLSSLARRYGQPSAADSTVIHGAVTAAEREATVVVGNAAGPSLTDRECDALEAIWARLWQRIDTGVHSAVRDRLRLLRESGMRKEPTL